MPRPASARRRTRRRALGAVLVVGAVLLGPAPPARAQEDGADDYRQRITQALEEFEAGRWAEARALFRRAHAIEPNARTLRGVAMTSFELREYAAAMRAIDAALGHAQRPLTQVQRAHVLDLRRRAEAFVAIYDLALTPAAARVMLDGVPAPSGPVVVDLGEHVLRVVADGHRPWERRVRVAGGERERLTVVLEPEGEPVTSVPAAPTPREADPVAPPRVSPRDDTAAHALLVGGGAALIGAVGSVIYWVSREDALARCLAGACLNPGVIRTERDAGVGIAVSLTAAAVGLGVAAIILLIAPGAGTADAARPCEPTGAGVRCRF